MSGLAYTGAGAFGLLVGWYVYYINRYRKGDVQLGDLTTVLGVIGGGVVTVLFDDKGLFGAYGIGLALGFFGYFLTLIYLVGSSPNFTADWFLDGRRKRPDEPFYIPDGFDAGSRPGMMPQEPDPALARAIDAGAGGTPSASFVFPPANQAALVTIDPNAARIIETCEESWPSTKADCSAFVRDVAHDLSVTLTGNADSIVGQISGVGWDKLADGRAAKAAADAGRLVIGGLKGADQAEPSAHGHVVVVVSGPLAHAAYPTAYWGRLGGVGEQAKTVNWAWRAGDRDRVIYGARTL